MKLAGVVSVVALLAAAAGCLGDDPTGNRNLRSPRLVVDVTPDDRTTMYLHAAFSKDHVYDRMDLELDGEPVVQERWTYALTHKTNRSSFNLTVDVQEEGVRFRYGAHMSLEPTRDRVQLRPWDDVEGFGPLDNRTLPFSKIVPSVRPEEG